MRMVLTPELIPVAMVSWATAEGRIDVGEAMEISATASQPSDPTGLWTRSLLKIPRSGRNVRALLFMLTNGRRFA